MEKKTSGRRKVEMKAIGDESKRHVAFSKRKAGIFNKAAELNVLTGAEVLVIIFSKYGKAYTFATPGSGPVVSSWLGERAVAAGNLSRRAADSECASAKKELRRLEDSARRLAEERRSGGEVDVDRGEFWWDRPVESAGAEVEKLEAFHEALLNLRRQVAARASALAAARGQSSAAAVGKVTTGSPLSEVYN